MKRISVITLLSAFLVSCTFSKPAEKNAHISFIIGDVTKNGSAVSINDKVNTGDIIKTSGLSSCDIQIGDSMIRIKENSNLTITLSLIDSNSEQTDLSLDSGKVLCKPKKLLDNESFTVRTPTAVAAVRGTQFSVTTDSLKTTRIKVFDGEVKVARRVKTLDKNLEAVIKNGSSVPKEHTAVISEEDALKAADMVDKAIADGQSIEDTISVAPLEVPKKQINTFTPSDFIDEEEIIRIGPKDEDVISKIATAVKKPTGPKGRLLVTRYDAYIIVGGKIIWESKLESPPLKTEEMVLIASSDRIVAASSDGLILWNTKLKNNGKVRIKGGTLYVGTAKGEKKLFIKNGRVY
ncbi:MAG: FecR domain-containing protein [Spirochaetes bacterium]|nr:FecR domain-containing protein [Spirochaetota bacterium]MBN2770365.1 FecR domain-containing protein [Spirochaetota bacterium]